MQVRSQWASRLGFILATAGAAVGLGNIQRFPAMVAQNGGAAFVIVYLSCVLLFGLPLILGEFALGRATQAEPLSAVKKLAPGSPWRVFGALALFVPFAILSYYCVVAGWTIAFGASALVGKELALDSFRASSWAPLLCAWLVLAVTFAIVCRGLQAGIERAAKVLMPLLFLLLIVLALRALTLPGAMDGLRFYLQPDFSKIDGAAIVDAMGQAFFSLCVGEAVLVTYASHVPKSEDLVASAGYVAVFDTAVAIIAGLIIFPVTFALGLSGAQGSGLVFEIMPRFLATLPMGTLWSFLFFAMLGFAALTTCVALLAVPASFLAERMGWTMARAAGVVSCVAAVLAIPAALSHGAHAGLSGLRLGQAQGWYEIADYVFGSLGMVVAGLGLSLFVAWRWGAERAASELATGSRMPGFVLKLWARYVRYVMPLVLLAFAWTVIKS